MTDGRPLVGCLGGRYNRLRMLGARVAIVGLVWAMGASACRSGPTVADLDRENPVRATTAPFGMEEFFAENAVEPDARRARLGRWLFYDTRLSADDTVSCATCHRPAHAFSAPQAVSVGIGGRRGRRKSQSLFNLGARTILVDTPLPERSHQFFWDGRATGLEAQVLMPVADRAEMGLDHGAMVRRISAIEAYRYFFRDAFGSDAVTSARVGEALADYVRTLRSGNSAYDRWAYGRDASGMSEAAQRGSDLFFFTARCAMCHAGFNFSDGRFHNLGVGWDQTTRSFRDDGRYAVTAAVRDRGRFKTPGLRDVTKHAPYMHDGSLATLREVIEFYNRGGIPNPGRSGRLSPLGLVPDDVDALVEFLKSLDGVGEVERPPRLFPR